MKERQTGNDQTRNDLNQIVEVIDQCVYELRLEHSGRLIHTISLIILLKLTRAMATGTRAIT